MNIKKLLNLQSSSEKVEEFKTLLKKSFEISKKIDALANDFAEKNGIMKSLSLTLDANEKKDAQTRYDLFLNEHAKNVAEVQKERESIYKSLAKLSKDEELGELFDEIHHIFLGKQMLKDRKITKSVYNDLIKARAGKVRYADVLLFRGSKLLILQRAGEYGSNSQEWCIPGGHVDPGEDFREAACRELFEETGIEMPEDLLYPCGVARGKDFEIHYFIGHMDDESPVQIIVDSEEEIGSAWIQPETELNDYEFIFDMKENIQKILGISRTDPVRLITKAYTEGQISQKIFEDFCKSHKEEIEKICNEIDFSHEVEKSYISEKERLKLEKEGKAMAGGRFPVRNISDLKNAIKLSGNSDLPKADVIAYLKRRAKELGATDEIPEAWQKDVEKTMDCDDVNTICKEQLDEETKKPDGDGIEKAITFKRREYVEKIVEKEEEPSKYSYGQGQFTYSDSDGGHGDKLFDFLGTLQKVSGLGKKFSIELKTEENGEQVWDFKGSLRINGLTKMENVQKSVDNEVEGFKMLIDFNDLDQAEMFKALVNEMKDSGKLDIEYILDNNEDIEKSLRGESIEKAKRGYAIGTEKTYGGKVYVKTEKGWRLKPKNRKEASSEKEEKSEEKEGKAKRSLKKDKLLNYPEVATSAYGESSKAYKEQVIEEFGSIDAFKKYMKDLTGFDSVSDARSSLHKSPAFEQFSNLKSMWKNSDVRINAPSIHEKTSPKELMWYMYYDKATLKNGKEVEDGVRFSYDKNKKEWIADYDESINKSEESSDLSEEILSGVFADYANFLEGAKTRSKNVHWGEEDNSKHVYLDDLIDELSEYEDKIMEAGQSEFGRFEEGAIYGEDITENDPVELVVLIIQRTLSFYEAIEDNIDYVGIKSWVEDFIATLQQTKYRLQMH